VFVAVDRALGRKVVVKVLPPELAAGVNRERFRREIQVAAQLQHPHIVPLLAAGEQGDLLWYTMPFIDGESLRAALERKKSFSPREVIRILHDVVDALAFAHERGVIHRDIKPANALTQGSHALVADFGVAKAISAALPLSGVTSTGIAIGTPAYMAPEQLAGDSSADHRMDIYAVGLLAYELLTGVSPFSGPSPRETLAAQLTRDPKPLHDLRAEIPRSLSTLIMRCLAKDPDERPQRADEILRELDAMTMPLGMTAQTAVDPASPLPQHRRRWLGIAAVAILAAALTGVGFVVSRERQSTSPPAAAPQAPVLQATPLDSAKRVTAAGARTALPAPPAAPPRPDKPLITHADSVRIAEAVRKRIEAAKVRDSIAKSRLAAETERKMMDSVIAANSGGAAGGGSAATARRVLIAEQPEMRQWPEAALLGRAVADSLRRMLRARVRQYTVIDQDSVRSALMRSGNLNEASRTLGSDLVVVIRFTPLPHDSAMLMLQVSDLGAVSSYRSRAASTHPVPKSAILASLDALLFATLDYMDEMSRAPRRD
jgi:serine/threonine-protein kinase